ncbi:hypothetical protein TVAG_123560 [Trichomonas vaginalis G3]|uniref:Uncharacterized protein n=1 Tax=Trichomonas vaginalis (strain ATCC PRA-98 / G3) TaxID=412133 RepID=A2FCT2_TRIV3|nr:hypothetical protein TVAGG3_0516430 [Trichomonas vaginalis G3]EAX97306.1 hypothetical protein TVAG_123560 [Trichomonas vaginalis G3]KAI5518165.1 hypothetical protein TVAGG3_0516430 [Trichomonas vaginalis G3]|eukprot:XP_001310236.1 hypothetical protein [Trichomonas vaginalis G3]
MSKKKAEAKSGKDLSELADSLIEVEDLEDVSNSDLCKLQTFLPQQIPLLIRSSKYVIARNYSRLLDRVKEELTVRTAYIVPAKKEEFTHPELEKYDEETDAKIRIIEERAIKLDQEVVNVWETQLKQKYFIPSPAIAEMRDRAKRMEDRGDIDGAKKLKRQADELEKMDNNNMETSYAEDLHNARMESKRKCNQEILKLINSRQAARDELESSLKAKQTKKKKHSAKKTFRDI